LETAYTDDEIIDVAEIDDRKVGQTGSAEYAIHQFENFIGDHPICLVSCTCLSTLAPSVSPIALQVYNENTKVWDTVASNTTAAENVKITLSAEIETVNYKNDNQSITGRLVQYMEE
jgi:hypothetical protein